MTRKEEVYLVLGLIAAVMACIAGWVALVPVLQPLLSHAPTPTVAPQAAPTWTHAPTSEPLAPTAVEEDVLPLISIENQLLTPVQISIDGIQRGPIDSKETVEFAVEQPPVQVDFVVENQTDSDGAPLGDAMSGTFSGVESGESLTITNQIGEDLFFWPAIINNTGESCDIYVNDGYVSEQFAGVVPAYESVGAGYYSYFSNSNVTLYCGSEGTMYWWGIHPEEAETTELTVSSGSGYCELVLDE